MREILFRGKRDKRYCTTQDWTYGVPFIDHEGDCIFKTNTTERVVDPETVGQFTGLTDKNGKKIFEGDIIKTIFRLKQTNGALEREVKSVVEYGIGWAYSNVCGVCERFSDGSGISMLSVMDNSGTVDCEIIGNIHDNPELLKGE